MVERKDWGAVYWAVYKDSKTDPVLLGTSTVLSEAKRIACDTAIRVSDSRGRTPRDWIRAIDRCEFGLGIPLRYTSQDILRVGYCSARVHHAGEDVGHERVKYSINPDFGVPFLEFEGVSPPAKKRKKYARKHRIDI